VISEPFLFFPYKTIGEQLVTSLHVITHFVTDSFVLVLSHIPLQLVGCSILEHSTSVSLCNSTNTHGYVVLVMSNQIQICLVLWAIIQLLLPCGWPAWNSLAWGLEYVLGRKVRHSSTHPGPAPVQCSFPGTGPALMPVLREDSVLVIWGMGLELSLCFHLTGTVWHA
jgi:hypothetical protein